MIDLHNKKIILISPRFFGYDQEIKMELERRGAEVYFIDDRINNGTLTKAFFRLKLGARFGKKKVLNYFKNHIKRNPEVDYVISICPEGFSKEVIEYYKNLLPNAIFILYMWDSFKNRPLVPATLNLYDKAFTFDKGNAHDYNLKFSPLFYTKDYSEIGAKKKKASDFEYDLMFVGTAHSDRYNVIQKLLDSTVLPLRNFFFFYLQHPLLIPYYRRVDPLFRKIKLKDISFKSMNKTEVLTVIEKSKCIIDINHPKQTGLTIRTMEVLGAKRKLITTNKDIVNYDLYNSDNILLIDRENPILIRDFLEKPYVEIDEEIYRKYSIENWVGVLFS